MSFPLIVILGPTASGKSGLAIELAGRFGGEIISCDSVQIYRRLNIGSAKPSKSEQLGVPHHLIDLLDPDQLCTAGEYLKLGREALAEIRKRGRVPFVVGGTGLYLRALLEGLFEGPRRSEALRQRLSALSQRRGILYLHRLLRRVDEASARRISPKDKPKIVRALEVYFLTSKPLSWHFQSGRDPLQGFEILKLGLNPPRKMLYEAIDRRVEQMFSKGLIPEVQSILSSGFSSNLKPLQSLGYAQVIGYLEGRFSLEEAIWLTKRDTRRYGKRQLTWFRKEKGVFWFEQPGWDPQLVAVAQAKTAGFLKECASGLHLGEETYGEASSEYPGHLS